ncbi:MAG: hypothetical protein Q7S08_03240 [bacterium]|nr:hypothetical protein [bacterium]
MENDATNVRHARVRGVRGKNAEAENESDELSRRLSEYSARLAHLQHQEDGFLRLLSVRDSAGRFSGFSISNRS